MSECWFGQRFRDKGDESDRSGMRIVIEVEYINMALTLYYLIEWTHTETERKVRKRRRDC